MSLNDISDVMPQQTAELIVTSYVGKLSGSYNFKVNIGYAFFFFIRTISMLMTNRTNWFIFFSLHIDKLRIDEENGLFYISDDAYRLQNIIKILLLIPIPIQFNLVLEIRFW